MVPPEINGSRPVTPSPMEKGEVEKSKESPKSPLTDRVLFPKASTAESREVAFSTKNMPVSDTLLKELDELLHHQAEEIEQDFAKIEEMDQRPKSVKTVMEVSELSLDIITTTHDVVNTVTDCLKWIFPKSVLDSFQPYEKLEKFEEFTGVGTTILTAADSGSKGLGLIYKRKAIEKSKELLSQYKEQNRVDATSSAKQITVEQQKKVEKTTKEWELYIEEMERILEIEKSQFKLTAASRFVAVANIPFKYLPTEVLEHLTVAKGMLAWTNTGIDIIGATIRLDRATVGTFNLEQWAKSYKEWLVLNQPQFKITDAGAQSVGFIPPEQMSLSDQVYERVFSTLIEKRNFLDIQAKLQECGIKLLSSITSKDLLLDHLKDHPEYKKQLIKQYIDFQRQLEKLNIVIATSSNLLEKRQAIMQKKIMMHQSRFPLVEPKIKEFKKQKFVKEMQQVLWQNLQNTQCKPEEITDRFQAWGLFDTGVAAQNRQLLSVLEQYKTDSNARQKMIDAFSAWMEDSSAMDQQFQNWFQAQPKEDLLRSYIDHQETLEITTKNALKQMVAKKHEIEAKFNNYNFISSHINFTIAAITITLTAAVAIFGLLSIPAGGLGLLLLMMANGSMVINYGLLGANYYLSYRYKPNLSDIKLMTTCYNMKILWTKIRSSIQDYFHHAKEKKLMEIAKILYTLHTSQQQAGQRDESAYQKALVNYQKAKVAFDASKEKVDYWNGKLSAYEMREAKASWRDFARNAALKVNKDPRAFDTMHALHEALKACDFNLLNRETRTLLEVQLGVNLEALQAQMKKNPEAIKNALQQFFVLDDGGLTTFIQYQQARIKKGLL